MTFKPLEQILVELITAGALKINIKSQADQYERAQLFLTFANIVGPLGTGDLTSTAAAVQTLVSTKVTDPVVAKVAQDFFNAISPMLGGIAVAEGAVPLFSAEAKDIATNVSAGITAIASVVKAP